MRTKTSVFFGGCGAEGEEQPEQQTPAQQEAPEAPNGNQLGR